MDFLSLVALQASALARHVRDIDGARQATHAIIKGRGTEYAMW